MLDRQFDHIIKNKLSGVQTETTPDWELFAQKQRAAKAEASGIASEPSGIANDVAFDAAVVKTIDAYKDTSAKPNWGAFLNKKTLADAEATKVENTNEGFDTEVKATVDKYETSTQPDWKAFQSFKSQKEDSTQIESTTQDETTKADDAAFDSQIKEELESFVPTSTPQWSQLADLKKVADRDAVELEKHKDFDEAIRAGALAFTLDPKTPLSIPQWDKFTEYQSVLSNSVDSKDSNNGTDIEDAPDAFDLEVIKEIENYKTSTQPDWAAFLEKKHLVDQDVIDINKHKDFDEAIRAGALAFTLDPNAPLGQPQWANFLDSKAQKEQELNNDNFDKDVRAEVDNYIAPQAAQWTAFLDSRAALESNYDNQRFDEEVEHTLEDHLTDSTPQWAKFKEDKKRKEKAAADGQFDKGVSGSLGKLKVRYNSEHWLLLRSRLQKIAQLRKNIFSYKSLEIIFTMLMFLTFANFYGPLLDKLDGGDVLVSEKVERTLDNSNVTVIEEVEVVNEIDDRTATATANENDIENTSSTSEVNKDNIIPSTTPALQKANNNANRDKTSSNNAQSDLVTNNNSTSDQSSGLSSSSSDIDKPVTEDVLRTGVDEKSNLDDALLAGATTPLDKNEDVVVRGLMNSLEAIGLGGIDFLNRGDEQRILRQPTAPVYIDLTTKKTYLDEGSWVHFFAGIENNYVRTPLFETNPTDPLTYITNDKNGYNFEALYSRVKGRWEIETGLGYNYVNYTPYVQEPITYINVIPREVTFSEVRLDLLSVPLRAKYHFVSNGRWSVFGHAGLINDLILKTGYSIDDNPKPLPTTTINPSELPDFYKADFTVGIFGDLPQSPAFVDYSTKSNVYILRGQLGIGAERNISDNVAAYLRADYAHTLYNSNIGPLNDRLNKVSIGMGFKYRLK